MAQTADNLIKEMAQIDHDLKSIGFCWENEQQILDQIISECHEVRASDQNQNPAHHREEIGDLLHAALSLCFYNQFNVAEILEASHKKFQNRLNALYDIMGKENRTNLHDLPLSAILNLWHQAKNIADASFNR